MENRVWRVRYFVGDDRKITTLGTYNKNDREGFLSQTAATAKAAELRRVARVEQKDPAHMGLTVNKLFDNWMAKHAKIKKKGWKDDAARYALHVGPRMGSMLLGNIKRRDVIATLDDIMAKAGGAQANRTQGLVSSILGWAVSEDLMEMKN